MSYKNIETSREIRLWIGQIIVPAVGLALAIPESREYLKSKYFKVREKVKNLLPKEKGL